MNNTKVNPPAPYVGGKKRLAKTLVGHIENIEHTTYAEPFVGMGGVFFRRNQKARGEVINDFNSKVSNLFRILQRHYLHFMEVMKFQITSRKEFERLKNTNPTTLTDLERAARFLYLQRTAFGGLVTGQTFGTAKGRPARFDITKLGPMLEDVHERLSGVAFENLHYIDFLKRYDATETLFYLDPPYWNSEDYYAKRFFKKEDFTILASVLSSINGMFILSINDVPEIRDIFKRFFFKEVTLSYSVSKKGSVSAHELIISNIPL